MKMPALFVGHGSPMLALDNNNITKKFTEIGDRIINEYGKPKAILCISAHWYTKGSFTQDEEKPSQIFDMYGFPEALYNVKYEVDGNRELTTRILELTKGRVKINNQWGIDHGTWTVLLHMFKNADIPVVQLSVDGSASIEELYEMGNMLSVLRDEGYLIIGSGNIVHNLRLVNWNLQNGTEESNDFDEYIKEAIINREDAKVINYHNHKNAKYSVPTLDHFLPIIYILGASKGEKPEVFNNIRTLGTISMTSYFFNTK